MKKQEEEFQEKARTGVIVGLGALLLVGLFQFCKDGAGRGNGQSRDWQSADAGTGQDFDWHPPGRG